MPRTPSRTTTPRTRRRTTVGGSNDDSTPRRERQNFMVPNAYLPSMFCQGNLDVEDIKTIIRQLNQVQNRAGNVHRFHLIVESELGQVEHSTAGVLEHVATRVLFSPSISPYDEDEDDQLAILIRVLNGISSRNVYDISPSGETVPVRGTRSILRENTPYNTVRRRPLPRRLFPADEEDDRIATEDDEPAEIRLPQGASFPRHIKQSLRFPPWFPFQCSEYTTEAQASREILYVNKEYINMFQYLDPKGVSWVYRQFFNFLHTQARRRKIKVAGTLKYSEFTPPWIRTRIVKDDETDLQEQIPLFLSKLVLTDIRGSRSTTGVKRMAYILGAFYQEEEDMAAEALEYLRRNLPICLVRRNKRRDGPAGRGQGASTRPRVSGFEIADTTQNRDHHTREIARNNTRRTSANDVQPDQNGTSPNSAGGIAGSIREPQAMAQVLSHSRPMASSTVLRSSRVQADMVYVVSDSDGIMANTRPVHRNARRLEQTVLHIDSQTERENERGGRDDVEPAGSPSEREEIDIYKNHCAAGESCRLRDSVFSQYEPSTGGNGITGNCRECTRPLHDLCGGGEDGDMLCPHCKNVRTRREITLQ